jgi:hypothetical protein
LVLIKSLAPASSGDNGAREAVVAAGTATRCNTQETMQHALRITATTTTYNIFLAFSPAAFTDSDLCASCTN